MDLVVYYDDYSGGQALFDATNMWVTPDVFSVLADLHIDTVISDRRHRLYPAIARRNPTLHYLYVRHPFMCPTMLNVKDDGKQLALGHLTIQLIGYPTYPTNEDIREKESNLRPLKKRKGGRRHRIMDSSADQFMKG